MARLTGFSRLLITLAIVAGVFFAVRYFLPNLGKGEQHNQTTEQQEDNPSRGKALL